MRRIITLIALAIVICGSGVTQSQPPAPTPAKVSDVKQSDAAKNKNGGGDIAQSKSQGFSTAPPIVASPPDTKPAVQQPQTHQDKPPHDWWHEADWFVALGTGFLAAVTGVLAFFTFRLWRATYYLAIDAKKTAQWMSREKQTAKEIGVIPNLL